MKTSTDSIQNQVNTQLMPAARAWHSLCLLILLFLYPAKAEVPLPGEKAEPLLAVIDIANNTGEFQTFIAGMPDMLITELLQTGNVKLVERTKIQTAMRALKMETSGLTRESNLELGKWLGVDKIIVGVFNKLGNNYRLDIRVIEVKTGKISHAVSCTKPRRELIEIVAEVGEQLRLRIGGKHKLKARVARAIDAKHIKPKKHIVYTQLRVEYKMIVGIFAQVSIPFQRVRIYLDDKQIHMSPVINRLNSYFTLYQGSVPVGKHTLRLVHGTVDKRGRWIRELDSQPKAMLLDLTVGDHPVVKYRMRAEDRWNTFSPPNVKW